jgi:glycosyltransferase involved in cell wall biosynthesis
MKKLLRLTTIPLSLDILLKGQLAFLNKHFEVIGVSSPGKELNTVSEREKIRVIPVNMAREISLANDARSLIQLVRLFQSERPDIVHSNTPKSSLLSMIGAKIARVPRRIYTVTGLRYETEFFLKRWILMLMERLTCFCATHVVAESIGVKSMLLQDKITSKKISIIGNGNINGIDEEFWNPDSVNILDKQSLVRSLELTDDFVFLFVGRVAKDKGIEELIQAFTELSDTMVNVRLLIAGPLEHRSGLSDSITIKMLNHKKISFLGFRNDIRELMSVSNVLVLPSYREGFPNVILQAGAMGLPLIITDVNGVEESVTSATGIIIKKGSVRSLLGAMFAIVRGEKKFDTRNCRNIIVSKFSQKLFYPKLLEYYLSL